MEKKIQKKNVNNFTNLIHNLWPYMTYSNTDIFAEKLNFTIQNGKKVQEIRIDKYLYFSNGMEAYVFFIFEIKKISLRTLLLQFRL